MRRILSLISLLLALAAIVRAQTVRWQPAGGTLAIGQTTELSLIFEECEPSGEIVLPTVPGLNFGRASRGEQSSFNVVNGKAARTRTIFFTYPARPTIKAPLRIPSFEVATDKGRIRVAEAAFDVTEPMVGGGTVPLDAAANSQLTTGNGTSAWAGEVLPINYTLSISNRFPAQLASNPDWAATPLVVEEWSKPEPFSAVAAGETRNNIVYQARGYIKAPGTYTLNPVNQLVNLRVPSSTFSVFQAFQAEQFSITSNRPTLTVKPLPQPAPAGFNGAVGDFKLVSKVVPERAGVSEPVTWTLELTGTGNWPDLTSLPQREASKDFRVVQPQARRNNKEGALFEATLSEDVVLIPTKPGTYTLGPVVWSYFDPKSGTYKTLTSERVTVTITAPAEAAASIPGATPGFAPRVDVPASAELPKPPEAPAPIPRDPIAGQAEASEPWTTSTTTWAVIASMAWIPFFWLALAWRHARAVDTLRPRREAHARIIAILADLKSTKDPKQVRALLRRWQTEVAAFWPLRKAAPASSAFKPEAAWTTLWNEAERALYADAQALPADWVTRAQSALAARPIPAFPIGSIFGRRHLMPFLGALVVGLLAIPSAVRAADKDPLAAYNGSEFSLAEKGWRDSVSSAPTDWIARHNLSLALGQQSRWGEAAGHAIAAFVQSPSDEAVRWNLRVALERAGYAPAEIGPFTEPGGRHRLASWFSPAGWQRAGVACGFLFAAGLAVLLLGGYGLRGLWPRLAAASLMLVAILGLSAMGVSLSTYGATADARAVVVWHQATLRSIPTEADTAQTTTALGAGSVAIVDKSFLGWIRLVFESGQTGWVRQEDVVRLYR